MKNVDYNYDFQTIMHREENLIYNVQVSRFDIQNIMLDTFGSEYFCDTDKQIISLTIPNRENRRLIIFLGLKGNCNVKISSVTYGGMSLVRLIGLSDVFDENKIEFWDLVSPEVGTHDLIVTVSGVAGFLDVGYVVIYNASQQNNIIINSGLADSKNIVASVKPILNNCWFFSVGYPRNNLIQGLRGGNVFMNTRFAWAAYSFSKDINKHKHVYKGLTFGERWIWAMIAVSPATNVIDRVSQAEAEMLTDNFDDGLLDSRWIKFTLKGGDVYEKNGQLHFKLKNNKRASWAGIQSRKTFDFRGCLVEMEIVYAHKGDTWLDLILSREKLPSNNFIIIGVDVSGKRNNSGTPALTALLQVNGVDNLLAVIDYEPGIHRYVRMREHCGTVYFEWSADRNVWNELYNMSSPFDMSSLYLVVDDFAYSNESRPDVHIIGNLRVAAYEGNCFVNIEALRGKLDNLLDIGENTGFKLENMDKLEKGKYYWRVRSKDIEAGCKWGEWKKGGMFEII